MRTTLFPPQYAPQIGIPSFHFPVFSTWYSYCITNSNTQLMRLNHSRPSNYDPIRIGGGSRDAFQRLTPAQPFEENVPPFCRIIYFIYRISQAIYIATEIFATFNIFPDYLHMQVVE